MASATDPAEVKTGHGELARLRATGVLCSMAIVVLFAGFILLSRMGLSGSIAVADLAALRFGVAGLLLAPVLLRFGWSGLTLRQALMLAMLGGLGSALSAYAGFSLAPASHGAVLFHGTLPLTTFLALAASGQRPVSAWRLAGIGLIAAGVLIMVSDSIAEASTSQVMGDASLVAASACWSAYGVVVSRIGLAPIRAAATVAVISMACFLPFYAVTAGPGLAALAWNDLVLQGVFQGVLIGACSIFLYTRAVAALGVSDVSLFVAAVPGVTTIGAIPLLHEWPTPTAVAGIVVVTAGMVVSVLGPGRPAGHSRPQERRCRPD